jgi:hypothetical protein
MTDSETMPNIIFFGSMAIFLTAVYRYMAFRNTMQSEDATPVFDPNRLNHFGPFLVHDPSIAEKALTEKLTHRQYFADELQRVKAIREGAE